MEWSEIAFNCINALVNLLIIPVIGILGKYALDLIDKKLKNEKARKYAAIAANVVSDVVTSVSQVYVDNLKKENVFDEAAQKAAFDLALSTAKQILSDEVMNALSELYGDVDEWLTAQIEASVRNQKSGIPVFDGE